MRQIAEFRFFIRFNTFWIEKPRSRKCAICDDHRGKLSNVSNLAERLDVQTENKNWFTKIPNIKTGLPSGKMSAFN